MLNIQTFDARAGGNVLYKALAHPLAAEAIGAALRALGTRPVALFDPDDIAAALLALYPGMPAIEGCYVHDVTAVGQTARGAARPAADRAAGRRRAGSVLIAAFDAGRIAARICIRCADRARRS